MNVRPAHRPLRRRANALGHRPASSPEQGIDWGPFRLLRDVDWSVSYAAFLAYILAIVTYMFPIGQAAMVVALLALPFEKRKVRLGRPVLLFGLFTIWAVATGALSPLAGEGYLDTAEVLVKLFVVFLLALSVLNSRGRILFFMLSHLGLFILFPVRGGIVNKFVYGHTMAGRMVWNYIFSNPNDLAVFCFLPVALGVAILVSANNHRFRMVGAGSLALLTLVIVSTASRGAMLGMAAFLLIFVATGKKWLRGTIAVGFAVILALALAPPEFTQRMTGLRNLTSDIAAVDEEGSAENRTLIAVAGLQIAKANAITGVGLGEYEVAHLRHVVGRAEFARIAKPKDAHNTYLRVLVETGVPGLALFMTLLVSVFLHGRRSARRAARFDPNLALLIRVLVSALAGFMVSGLFGSYAMLSFLYLHLALIISTSRVADDVIRTHKGRAHRRRVVYDLPPAGVGS